MSNKHILLVVRMVLRQCIVGHASPAAKEVNIADNEIAETTKDNLLFRAVGIDCHNDIAWLCNIYDDSWPFFLSKKLLEEQINSEDGCYRLELDDPWGINHIRPSINGSKIEAIRDERYTLVEPLIARDNEIRLLIPRERGKLIAQRVKEVNSTRQTISQLIKRWYKRGMTINAFLPDYANCGTPKSGKRKIKVKLGAPRIITPGKGTNITDENLPMVMAAAELWLADKDTSYADALEEAARLFIAKPVVNDKNVIIDYVVNADKRVTSRQLQSYIHETYPDYIIRRCRYGEAEYLKHGRDLPGKADHDVQGPGDVFIIDSTIADAYLVSELDRNRIVGRPVLYFIIDLFSRMITGFWITFEGPSWEGSTFALVNMATPKVELCKRYGVNIEEYKWPSHHLSRIIMGDKGELLSTYRGQFITKVLRMEIQNTTAYRPDMKAIVERRFLTIPKIFHRYVPGYVKKDFNQRGSDDYRLQAAMTLSQFAKQVILSILRHNATNITDYNIPPKMITASMNASPRQLWKWGEEHRSGLLRTFNPDEVALGVLERKIARVTPMGIRLFRNVYYTCPTAEREGWFADARSREWDVELSYDINRCGYAYINNPNKQVRYEPCRLNEPSDAYTSVSQFEIEELDIARKRNETESEHALFQERLGYLAMMSETERESREQAAAMINSDMSDAERTSNIREKRAMEADYERSKRFPLSPAPAKTGNEKVANLEERKALRRQRMRKAIAMLNNDDERQNGETNEKNNANDGPKVH